MNLTRAALRILTRLLALAAYRWPLLAPIAASLDLLDLVVELDGVRRPVVAADPVEQHFHRRLVEPPVNTLPLSVKISSGTP
jgi:hypothetical protein